jgi:bifunctional DNA-binding transcriptional regulator/antitoxin component of YhaV-PrlF toxin-antitoxin module
MTSKFKCEVKKSVKITSKRQFTIPIEFYKKVGFINDMAECICRDGEIILRPKQESTGYFAEQILKDLIEQGYKDKELLEKFKELNGKVPKAIRKVIKESDKNAIEFMKNGYVDETDDIFSD